MKNAGICALLLLTAVLYAGCSMSRDAGSSTIGSPQNPPLPKTNSVLPLAKGNQWVFSNTLYDASGAPSLYNRASQTLSIPRMYGWIHDTTLLEINDYTYHYLDSCVPPYVYALEWDNLGYGDLVSYLQTKPVKGVYIIGTYHGTSISLYDTARLWLAYPVLDTMTYTLNRDPGGDTTGISSITVMSTRERFYYPDSLSSNISSLTFSNCYLYRETFNGTEAYYYYNEAIGALGYQQLSSGVLRRTYILRAFHEGEYNRYAD